MTHFTKVKGLGYRPYWKENKHERLGIKGFRVLIVTKSEKRKDNMRAAIREWLTTVTPHPSEMWIFTSEERYHLARPESILQRIWQTAPDDRLVSLVG